MARFADLIGSISDPATSPQGDRVSDDAARATHGEVTAAIASIAAPPVPPAPDPTRALASAFGTEIAHPAPPVPPQSPDETPEALEINDDLLPSRPAKGRRR